MNKLFITLIVILFAIRSNGQITLEHSYPNGKWKTSMVKLANSGMKYMWSNNSTGQLILYNLDHSIFKSMNYPVPASNVDVLIYYISETTFDLDNEVEFMAIYDQFNNVASASTKIINEDGTVIFTKNGETPPTGIDEDEIQSIFNTSNGTKMILDSYNDNSEKVYNLPGTLIVTNIKNYEYNNNFIKPYPNPANSYIRLAYTLPSNIKEAKVSIFDVNGNVIRTYRIDGNFKELLIDTNELVDGLYFCQINSNGQKISSTEFLVKK